MMRPPDMAARHGILAVLSARLSLRGNIHRRIASAMTLYAICVILVIGAVSYVAIDLQIRKNQRLAMEGNARELGAKLASTLDAVQESLSNLATNTLLVNALVDTSGNLPYMESFIRNYRPAGRQSIHLTLCDFQGNPVASSLPAPGPYNVPELLRQTLERGLPFAGLLPREQVGHGALFVVAYPVVWKMTSRAEGILVAEIPAGEIVAAHLSTVPDGLGLRVRCGDRVVYSRDFADRAGFQRFEVPLTTSPPMRSLQLALQVENHERLSLWWLIPIYAASGAILFAFSMVVARRVSGSVTSHLAKLGAAARHAAESGSLDRRAEVAGPDDVQELASSFNAMVDRVQAAKEDLERRVAERTADLSAANEELVRLNRDKEAAIVKLKEALDKISTLRGLLPICARCKKIRDDQGYWQQIEVYISDHTEADFTHGICPDCARAIYPKRP